VPRAAPLAAAARAPRPLAWLVPAVVTGALAPLASMILGLATGALGADPVAEALNRLGLLALVLLVASLAMTPLKIVTGWTWPIRLRKALGLLGFAYATLHFLVYAAIDQGLAIGAILDDVTERPFIAVGAAALVLLVPLAITSTAAMLKRLGFARWKRLHRLAYVVAGLGVVHFVLRVKKDLTEPLVYGVVLAVLLGVRVVEAARGRGARR
jgi:sulfoxide reductase heme-binding subunit YedZ